MYSYTNTLHGNHPYDSSPLRKTRHFAREGLSKEDGNPLNQLHDSGFGTYSQTRFINSGLPDETDYLFNSDFTTRKISHLSSTPSYLGFSIVGGSEDAHKMIPSTTPKSFRPRSTESCIKKGTESHTAASSNVIRTDDWKHVNQLILQELGPPPSLPKKRSATVDSSTEAKEKSKRKAMHVDSYFHPHPAHPSTSSINLSNKNTFVNSNTTSPKKIKERSYDVAAVQKYMQKKKSNQMKTVSHPSKRSDSSNKANLSLSVKSKASLCKTCPPPPNIDVSKKVFRSPLIIDCSTSQEILRESETVLLPKHSSKEHKRKSNSSQEMLETEGKVNRDVSIDEEGSLMNQNNLDDEVVPNYRKQLLQQNALNLLHRLAEFRDAVEMSRATLTKTSSTLADSLDDHKVKVSGYSKDPVDYGWDLSEIQPSIKTHYEKLIPYKTVVFKDDELPGATARVRRNLPLINEEPHVGTVPYFTSRNSDNDDDEDDEALMSRWRPHNHGNIVPNSSMFKQKKTKSPHSNSSNGKQQPIGDFTQRLPLTKDPFSFHVTYARVKHREKSKKKTSEIHHSTDKSSASHLSVTEMNNQPNCNSSLRNSDIVNDVSSTHSRSYSPEHPSQLETPKVIEPTLIKSSETSVSQPQNGQHSTIPTTVENWHAASVSSQSSKSSSSPAPQIRHPGKNEISMEEEVSFTSASTTSGRLSPLTLERRLLAELHYKDSLDAAFDQLGETEKVRALSLAHHETVSLAQLLQNQQIQKGRELESALLDAQREHQRLFGQKLEEIRHRTESATRQYFQALHKKQVLKTPEQSVPSSSMTPAKPTGGASVVTKPESTTKKATTQSNTSRSHATALTNQDMEESSDRSVTVDEGTLNVDTELDYDSSHARNDRLEHGSSTSSSIDEEVPTVNDEPDLHSISESVIEKSHSQDKEEEIEDDWSSFREVLPSEEHLRRHRQIHAQHNNKNKERTDKDPTVKNGKVEFYEDSADFDSLMESVVEQLKHDKVARERHKAELERIKRRAKGEKLHEDQEWLSRKNTPTKKSTAAVERYPEIVKSPREVIMKSDEEEDSTTANGSQTKEDIFQKMKKRLGINESLLTRREKELHNRREKAEIMLKWQKKLDEEEKHVIDLEIAVMRHLRSSRKGKKAQDDKSKVFKPVKPSLSAESTTTSEIPPEGQENSNISERLKSSSARPVSYSGTSAIPEEMINTGRSVDYVKSITEELPSATSYRGDSITSTSYVEEETSLSTSVSEEIRASLKSNSSSQLTASSGKDNSQISASVSDFKEIEAHVKTLREELKLKKKQLKEEQKLAKANLKREKDELAQQLLYYDRKIASLRKENHPRQEEIDGEAPVETIKTPPSSHIYSETSVSVDEKPSTHISTQKTISYGSDHFEDDDSTLAESRLSSSTKAESKSVSEEGSIRKNSDVSTVASEVEEVEDLDAFGDEGQTPRSARKLTFSDINEEYSASDHDDSISRRVQHLDRPKETELLEENIKSDTVVNLPSTEVNVDLKAHQVSKESSDSGEKSSVSISPPCNQPSKKPGNIEEARPLELNLSNVIPDQETDYGYDQQALLSARTIHSEMSDIPEDLDAVDTDEEKGAWENESDKKDEPDVITRSSSPKEKIKSVSSSSSSSLVSQTVEEEEDQVTTLPLYSEDFSTGLDIEVQKPTIQSPRENQNLIVSNATDKMTTYILSDEEELQSDATNSLKSSSHAVDKSPSDPQESDVSTQLEYHTDSIFNEVWNECINDCVSVIRCVRENEKKTLLESHNLTMNIGPPSDEHVKEASSKSEKVNGKDLNFIDLSSASQAAAVDKENSKSAMSVETYLEDFLIQRQRARALQFIRENRAYCEGLEVLDELSVTQLLREAILCLWDSVGRKIPRLEDLLLSDCAQQWMNPPDKFDVLPSNESDEELAQRIYPQGLRSCNTISRRALFEMTVEHFCHVYQIPKPENDVFPSYSVTTTDPFMISPLVDSLNEETDLQTFRQHFYPNTYPAAERHMFRLWRGTRPPETLEKLQEVILSEINPVLHPNSKNLQLSRVAQWTIANKQDHIDRLLVEDLRRDEAAWTTYDRDELRVKVGIADAILKWMVNDFIEGIQQTPLDHIEDENRKIGDFAL